MTTINDEHERRRRQHRRTSGAHGRLGRGRLEREGYSGAEVVGSGGDGTRLTVFFVPILTLRVSSTSAPGTAGAKSLFLPSSAGPGANGGCQSGRVVQGPQLILSCLPFSFAEEAAADGVNVMSWGALPSISTTNGSKREGREQRRTTARSSSDTGAPTISSWRARARRELM